jgi:hypothetical protein
MSAQPDQVFPASGRRVNPDGTVTYEFEGHVRAEGVELPAGAEYVGAGEEHRVDWIAEDGALVASIVGAYDVTDLGAPFGNLRTHRVFTGAQGPGGTLAYVEARASRTDNGQEGAQVVAYANGHEVVILDANGGSGFVQPGDQDVVEAVTPGTRLGSGATDVTFPAGAQYHDIAVAHDLGFTPEVVVALKQYVNDFVFTDCDFLDADDDHFWLRFKFGGVLGAAVDSTLYWIATG